MISHIKVEGYRTLRKVELDLSRLTVLIGPNGSGKSNLLDIFSLMLEAAKGLLAEGIASRGGFDALLFKGGSDEIFFQFDFPSEGVFAKEQSDVQYELLLRPVGSFPIVLSEKLSKSPALSSAATLVRRDQGGCMFRSLITEEGEEQEKDMKDESELAIFQVKDQDAFPTAFKLLQLFQSWTFYGAIDVGHEAAIRQPQLVRPGVRLSPSGANLVSVLHSIRDQHPAAWEEVCEIIKTVHPEFHSMTFPPEGGDGKIVLRWWEHPFAQKTGFSANLLSDGTLKLLCLIAILCSPDPPPLICIDEPELGLHPDCVKLVAELLQSASSRTQVIAATHSPQLVSKLKPEEVVVVEKEAAETSLCRLSEEELTIWMDKFSLGELWESGHIGGAP